MENRVARTRPARPGAALIALAAILLITAAWWALALWPAGSGEPEWLARTRAACFGSPRGGLPDAGGWVLLIGEPLGMLAALVIVFGDSLRRDLRLLGARRAWRVGALAAGMLPLGGMLLVAARAAGVPAAAERHQEAQDWWLSRVDREAPFVVMLDQHGQRFSLADVRRQPVVVTFAFAHCTTVCPAIVSDLRAARRGTGRADIPLLVITLDPWRDTPERLPALAATWGLGPGDRALSGSVADVERVLDDLGVGRRRIEQNGDIEHIGTAMIVDANGRIAWRLDGSPRGVAALLAKL